MLPRFDSDLIDKLKHIGHMRQNRRNFLNLLARSEPRVPNYWLHVNRTAMACRFEVTMRQSEEVGIAAATDALDEIDRLESRLTVFRDSSEVSVVNSEAAKTSVEVSSQLFDLLTLCKQLYEETAGAFDITSGPLTRCWGFLRRQGRLPAQDEIDQAMLVVGSDKLLFDETTRSVRFERQGMEINLGSIGKGYALDSAANLMSTKVSGALLNAGSSSMRAIGKGEHGDGWLVGLRNPRSKLRRLGVLRLRDCALSTSGSEEQFFEDQGKRYSHIIDPRSGWPASGVTSVSVVAPTAAVSDALATAFFVGGRELAERYCQTHTDVLVIMLESQAAAPITFGHSSGCDGLQDL
jgi:FAD:protein FMN transferase